MEWWQYVLFAALGVLIAVPAFLVCASIIYKAVRFVFAIVMTIGALAFWLVRKNSIEDMPDDNQDSRGGAA